MSLEQDLIDAGITLGGNGDASDADVLTGAGPGTIGSVTNPSQDPLQMMYFDTQNNRLVTGAEAFQIDPGGFADVLKQQIPGDPSSGSTIGSYLRALGAAAASNPLKTLAALGSVGVAGAGLFSALSAMARQADGSSIIKLPNGQDLHLSPQETALLDIATKQATAQGKISAATTAALSEAATAAAPDITKTFTQGVGTAATQTGTQGVVAGAANAALTPSAQNIFTADLTNAQGMQGAQGAAVTNITNLLRKDAGLPPLPVTAGGTPGTAGGAGVDWNAELTKLAINPDSELGKRLQDPANAEEARGYGIPIPSATPATEGTPTSPFSPATPEQLNTAVGSAAATNALDLLNGAPVLPANVLTLGEDAVKGVSDYAAGESTMPAIYDDQQAATKAANQTVTKGLTGDLSASPFLQQYFADLRQQTMDRLKQELGPGWDLSTPGGTALNKFDVNAGMTQEQDLLNRIATAQGVAGPGNQFTEQVLTDRANAYAPYVLGVPQLKSQIGLSTLGTMAGIGNQSLLTNEQLTSGKFGRAAATAGGIGSATNTAGNVFQLGNTGAPTPSSLLAALLGQNGGALSLSGLSALTPYTQANNNAATTNALLDFQAQQNAIKGGGQLFGQVASPFLKSVFG